MEPSLRVGDLQVIRGVLKPFKDELLDLIVVYSTK